MRIACVFLLAVIFAGCAPTPLDEINFTGKPLAVGVDPFVEAEKFAAALARDARLEVVDLTKRSGSTRWNDRAAVYLKRDRASKVLVCVIVYASEQEVRVMIQPASATPLSKELADDVVRTYRKLYGNSEFSRWQRYQGLLGP